MTRFGGLLGRPVQALVGATRPYRSSSSPSALYHFRKDLSSVFAFTWDCEAYRPEQTDLGCVPAGAEVLLHLG